jgi:hypothetical protein
MLIKFSMVSGQSFSMFEKDAVEMLHAMDLSGNIPSAINPEDIPSALKLLENKLNSINADEEKGDQNEDSDDGISAKTRAFPLIELLKNAIKEEKSVMWEKA